MGSSRHKDCVDYMSCAASLPWDRLAVSDAPCPASSSFFHSIHDLRNKVSSEHTDRKQKELEDMPKASHGYGGKFGIQEDRMDSVSWKSCLIFLCPLTHTRQWVSLVYPVKEASSRVSVSFEQRSAFF